MKNLKQTHESASCQRFLLIYNKEQNMHIELVRLGESNIKEPDCICNNNFAIELAGVYDNSYQAEKVWSVPRDKDVGQQINYNLLSLENLQNEIGIKLSKLNSGNYAGFSGKTILVLHLQSPLLQDEAVENYVNEYVPFRLDGWFEKYFYQVYISWRSSRYPNWKIRRLE